MGYKLRQAGYADIASFLETLSEEDKRESFEGFGVDPATLLDTIWGFPDRLGFVIASIDGEDCLLCGVHHGNPDDGPGITERDCFIWTLSSEALKRHKIAFVKNALKMLCDAIHRCKAYDKVRVFAHCWSEHPICRTVERHCGARYVASFEDISGKGFIRVYKLPISRGHIVDWE